EVSRTSMRVITRVDTAAVMDAERRVVSYDHNLGSALDPVRPLFLETANVQRLLAVGDLDYVVFAARVDHGEPRVRRAGRCESFIPLRIHALPPATSTR